MSSDPIRFFHPVLAARDLRRAPVRVEIAGRAYALFRDHEGRPSALGDACPHRSAPLSRGVVRPDGRLACPYHGWHFDREGRGVNPSQPTLRKCDTESFQLVERYDYLWLAERETSPDTIPALGGGDWELAGEFAMKMPAPLQIALDNFSENEHVPWVHDRLGWDEGGASNIEFEATNFDDRTEVRYRARQRASMLLPLLLLRSGDVYHNAWVTRFDPVRTEYTISWTDPHGVPRPVETRATIFMVPESERTTRFHVFTHVRCTDAKYRAFMPIVRRAALALGWFEVWDDARFLPVVAHTPLTLEGRLDRFDKPLVHNRKLLARVYYGTRDDLAAAPRKTVV
jgi:phenylpropionate dioxygenase-like ring-hydroxylating dioxygenase large terminal subunit